MAVYLCPQNPEGGGYIVFGVDLVGVGVGVSVSDGSNILVKQIFSVLVPCSLSDKSTTN